MRSFIVNTVSTTILLEYTCTEIKFTLSDVFFSKCNVESVFAYMK